jgi:ribosome assembly protein SQT1
MSAPNREEPQDTGDHEMVDWEAGAEELDQDFQTSNCIEIDLGSDDEAPESDDDLDIADAGGDVDVGVVDENEVYSDDDAEFRGVDDSVASVTHKESVLTVGFSPTDQRVLVTGGQDDVAVLWGLEDAWGGGVKCTQRCRLEGHTDSVIQVAFCHDGKYVATGGYDGTVRIWLAENGSLVHALEGPSKEVEWIMWHPKGYVILAGSTDTMAWMWWAPTGKLMQIFAGHAQSVTCGAWGLGGKVIVTGSEDKSVIVWNPKQGTPQQTIRNVHDSTVVTMCSHPDAPLVVTGSEDAVARVVQIETGKVVATLSGHLDSVEAVGFSNAPPGGMTLLATASMDGKAMIWDGKTFDLRCTLTDHFERGGIVKFKWLPVQYGNMLCTCATDATLRLFNAMTGQCLRTLRGHRDTILDLDLTVVGGDKLCLASGSDDNSCRVFVVPLNDLQNVPSAAAVVRPQQQEAQQVQQQPAVVGDAGVSSSGAALAFQPPPRPVDAAAAPESTGAPGDPPAKRPNVELNV